MEFDYYDEWLDEDEDFRPQKIGRTSKAPKQKAYQKEVKKNFRKEKQAKQKLHDEYSGGRGED